MANRIARRQPVTIVAIGSSSTAGVGASAPETTYPSRLEAELKARIPGAAIRVVNHGVSGDQVRDMLARFDTRCARRASGPGAVAARHQHDRERDWHCTRLRRSSTKA